MAVQGEDLGVAWVSMRGIDKTEIIENPGQRPQSRQRPRKSPRSRSSEAINEGREIQQPSYETANVTTASFPPRHAIELAAGPLPTNQPLIDYVQFAQVCQNSAAAFGHFGRASYFINGNPRDQWTDQSDGPALQTLAILQLFTRLDGPTQAVARAVIDANLSFLLGAYQDTTTYFNLWEEHTGASLFTRAVQLRCFEAIQSNTIGIATPPALAGAITWLQNALQTHWNGQCYQSLVPAPSNTYDPNIDIVLAAIYGAIPVTDTKLLATAALLRSQWTDPNSPYFYPINGADQQQRGIGPMLGRYPGDVYDGNTDAQVGDHPWAVSTCALAELYYRLASAITTAVVPLDALSTNFFSQVSVDAQTTPAAAAAALQAAGDKLLQAVIFHSDHYELSEQFDATSGYEKSVSDLSWSYASFLSAVRAR